MVHGVPPPYGYSSHNSLHREGPKFGIMLPNMKGDGKNSCIPLPDDSKRYYAIQPLVEDNIPRFTLWHHLEYGLYLIHGWIKVL